MAGALPLAVSILRRDRLRFFLWTVGILGLTAYVIFAFQSIYETEADLLGYARVAVESPAARAFAGPGYGLDPPSIGAAIANDGLGFLAAAAGLMSVFLVARNTRAEEEDGRAELIEVTGIGRHARSAAAMGAVSAANVGLGAAAAAMLVASGLDFYGSAVFGASIAGCGIVFAALTLLSAQISAHARVATAIAGGALGGAYVVRALGDIDGSSLSLLSPIGWAQAARPYAGEEPGYLALLAGATAVLAALAITLERRRDLGSGIIESRPGPARGRSYMARSWGLALRLQRLAIASWLLGVALLGFVYGTVATDVEDLIRDTPEFADYLARTGGDLVDSYFVTILFVVALVASGFAIQSLLRIRSEETSGRAEAVLACGISRTRWALGFAMVTLLGIAVIMIVGGAAAGLGFIAVGGPASYVGELALASLAWIPALAVMFGLIAFLIGVLPRLALTAWALLGVYFFIGFFGEALDLPGWLRAVSPFEHVPEVPAGALELGPLAFMTAIGAALSVAALFGLRRRDIG